MCRHFLRKAITGLIVAQAIVALAGVSAVAETARHVEGPVAARLLRVVDGDTIEVLARIWPDHYVEARVRIAGIDAPELRSRCPAEREKALAAQRRLEALLKGGSLQLRDIRYGKFAGRVVARVIAEGGRDVGEALIGEGLARPYAGGRRMPWCVAER